MIEINDLAQNLIRHNENLLSWMYIQLSEEFRRGYRCVMANWCRTRVVEGFCIIGATAERLIFLRAAKTVALSSPPQRRFSPLLGTTK